MKAGYIHGVGPGEKRLAAGPRHAGHYRQSGRNHSGTEQNTLHRSSCLFATTSPHTPIVPTAGDSRGQARRAPTAIMLSRPMRRSGRVVAALKAAGVYETTLLVVSSDNGPAPFMRERIRSHQHHPSGPLRGLKRDLLEGGHRVPFIATWPDGGSRAADAGSRRTLSLADLFATMAGVVGAPLDEGVAEDSLDILPALRAGEPRPQRAGLPRGQWHAGTSAGTIGPICARAESPRRPSGTRRLWQGRLHSMQPGTVVRSIRRSRRAEQCA